MKAPFTFQQIAATLLAHMLLGESTLHELTVQGVVSAGWPEGSEERSIFEKFQKLQCDQGWGAARVLCRTEIEKNFERNGLGQLFAPIPVSELLPFHQKAAQRERAIDLGRRLIREPERVEELKSAHSAAAIGPGSIFSIESAFARGIELFDKQRASGGLKRVLPKFKGLSEMVGGFNVGRFAILFADTGFGKTNLAAQIAIAASEVTETVYFNMEMVELDFFIRMYVALTGKTYAEVYREGVDKLTGAMAISDKRLHWTMGSSMTVEQVAGSIIERKQKLGADFFIVDYDQKLLLPESKDPEWKELQRVAIYFEEIAKREKVYILMLAQSNFEGGISSSKRIQFGAYTVMRFHTIEGDDGTHDVIECIKNRGGEAGACMEVHYDRTRAWVREIGRYSKPRKERRRMPSLGGPSANC